MYNQVIFYNHFGAGDIFESREFVKEWMRIVPSDFYFYSHGKHRDILLDIDNLMFKEVTDHMHPSRALLDDGNGNLYVNTWIGRDSSYVLPGIGCTVEKLFDMHNDLLGILGFDLLGRTPIDYIPTINYKKYSIKGISKFMKKNKTPKIFIDNGLVQSSQAFNFKFDDIIKAVSIRNPDKLFITSQKIHETKSNLVHSGDIIGRNGFGFDLNELSYVSTFCDVLIGRNSGPHVFTQTADNCSDPNKKLLSFTYEQQGSSFVVNSDVKIKKYWSNSTDFYGVLSKIEEVINE